MLHLDWSSETWRWIAVCIWSLVAAAAWKGIPLTPRQAAYATWRAAHATHRRFRGWRVRKSVPLPPGARERMQGRA